MTRCRDAIVIGVQKVAGTAVLSFVATTAAAQSPIPTLPADSVWRQDISSAPTAADSATVIAWLDGEGGWGSGTMRIDFSIEVLHADGL